MGEVYAGFDDTLQRRVALKAIHAEHRLSAPAKARFLREARILSQLDHPHVCRVYDFIEGERADWLVLELIEGKTLQVAIAGGLDPASRLPIAEQIAGVLVATHAAGVVHRDLKPGNVMLAGQDGVKVLDFGLAQSADDLPLTSAPAPAERRPAIAGDATVDGLVTRTAPPGSDVETLADSPGTSRGGLLRAGDSERGILVGTPAYMSPEQARGEAATAASDMYSFGLLLQEMYTGRPAYPQGIDYATLIDQSRRGDTLPPVGVSRDVAELIGRLKAPASAARPTATETAARLKWMREKPARRIRNLAIAAALMIAVVGAVKYTVDLARERTLAVAARQEADRRRDQAEDLIGFMLGDLRKRLEPVGRLDILDEVGNKAMGYFAVVPEAQLSDSELLRRSKALYQIGEVRISQGSLETATKPLEESLQLARTLVERQPRAGDRLFELGQSHYWVGFVHWRRQHLDEAQRHFEAYLDVANRLVSLDPAKTDWQREIAYANSNIGSVLEARNDLPGALQRFRATLAVEESLLSKFPDDSELQRSIASSHNAIGAVARAAGRLQEADAEFRAELAVLGRLSTVDPKSTTVRHRLGVSYSFHGDVLLARGDVAGGRQRFEQAIALFEGLVARDGSNNVWRRELARNRFKLGLSFVEDQPRRADPVLEAAVSAAQSLAGRDATNAGWQRDLAEIHCARGLAMAAVGDATGAARHAEAALTTTERLLAANPKDRQAQRIRSAGHALEAQIWRLRRNFARSREEWGRALEAIAPAASDSNDYRFLEPLATALFHTQRAGEAAVVLRKLNAMGYRSPRLLKLAQNQGLRLPAPTVSQEGRRD